MFRLLVSGSILLLAGSLLPCSACAQAGPGLDLPLVQSTEQTALPTPLQGQGKNINEPPVSVTVERGTRVLMSLKSPLHTTSGVQGSGIYLETLQPVVQGKRVVIPAHTQVQGTVEGNKRPGHFQRTAEFKFRFTTLIFPDNHVVSINGALQSIPGAVHSRPQEGTLRTVDQSDKVAVAAIAGATGGGILGSVSHLGIGKFVGAGLGAGLGMETVLLNRGDEISLPSGTNLEMVLESPFVLGPEQAAFNAKYVPPPEPQPQTSALSDCRQQPSRRAARRPPWAARRAGGMLFPEYPGDDRCVTRP